MEDFTQFLPRLARSILIFPSFKLCVKSGFAEQQSGGHEYFMAWPTRSSLLSFESDSIKLNPDPKILIPISDLFLSSPA